MQPVTSINIAGYDGTCIHSNPRLQRDITETSLSDHLLNFHCGEQGIITMKRIFDGCLARLVT